MTTVLVTGAAGYIGSVLCGELLHRGLKVIGVDSLIYNNGSAVLPLLGHRQFSFVRQDVRDATAIYRDCGKQADVIIPLAALVGAPVCDRHPIGAEQVNFNAVADLCSQMSSDQLLIYPNTNSGYGQTTGDESCVETDPLNPISIYGRTKCRAEQYVLDHHTRTVVFRLATVFGASPRMRLDLMVNDFTRRLVDIRQRVRLGYQRDLLHIFEPHFKRNFVHVRDVTGAFFHTIAHQESDVTPSRMSGVYNLGLPDSNLTKLELAHRICNIIGLSRDHVVESAGKDPDQRNYIVSNDKVLATGFQFANSLDKGIREVAQLCEMMSNEETSRMTNV